MSKVLRFGVQPPEPKVTGSNPVGRASLRNGQDCAADSIKSEFALSKSFPHSDQIPGFSGITVKKSGGGLIVHERLLRSVPTELSAGLVGDVGQMGDIGGLVAEFYVGDGALAGADAVDEVLDVQLGRVTCKRVFALYAEVI